MIYIASPYSSPIPEITLTRVQRVTQFVDLLISQGEIAFSPIVYCHPISQRVNVGTTATDWHAFNMSILRRCDAAYFLRLPGWEKSQGMETERKVCRVLHIYTEDYDADFNRVY